MSYAPGRLLAPTLGTQRPAGPSEQSTESGGVMPDCPLALPSLGHLCAAGIAPKGSASVPSVVVPRSTCSSLKYADAASNILARLTRASDVLERRVYLVSAGIAIAALMPATAARIAGSPAFSGTDSVSASPST